MRRLVLVVAGLAAGALATPPALAADQSIVTVKQVDGRFVGTGTVVTVTCTAVAVPSDTSEQVPIATSVTCRAGDVERSVVMPGPTATIVAETVVEQGSQYTTCIGAAATFIDYSDTAPLFLGGEGSKIVRANKPLTCQTHQG